MSSIKIHLNKVVVLMLLLGIVLVVISCKDKKQNTPPPVTSSPDTAAGPIQTPVDSQLTVIPFDEKQTWLFRGAKATKLSEKEISDVKVLLGQAVNEHNKTAKDFDKVKTLDSYQIQLVAVINQRGEKEVWVNCFCAGEMFPNWRTQIVSVDDGGNCFFNLKINLSEKKSYDMMVNGQA